MRSSIRCLQCHGFHPLPADKPDIGNEGYVYIKCPPLPKKRVLGKPKAKNEDDTKMCRCTHPMSLHGPWGGDASGETPVCRGCRRDQEARTKNNATAYHHFTEGGDTIPRHLPPEIRDMKLSMAIWKAGTFDGSKYCNSCGHQQTNRGHKETMRDSGWYVPCTTPGCNCNGDTPRAAATHPHTDVDGNEYEHFHDIDVAGAGTDHEHHDSRIEIPRYLPKEIREMKLSRRSALVFKSEDKYERCGQDGCGHPQANHSANICHECFKENGSASPIIQHAFKSSPGFTGSMGRPSGTGVNPVPASRIRVPHPNAYEVARHNDNFLTGISALRDKWHGTGNDETLKSKGIYDPRPKKKFKTFAVGGKGSVTPNKKVSTQAVPFDDMRDNGDKSDRGDLSFKPKANGKVRKSLKVYDR